MQFIITSKENGSAPHCCTRRQRPDEEKGKFIRQRETSSTTGQRSRAQTLSVHTALKIVTNSLEERLVPKAGGFHGTRVPWGCDRKTGSDLVAAALELFFVQPGHFLL